MSSALCPRLISLACLSALAGVSSAMSMSARAQQPSAQTQQPSAPTQPSSVSAVGKIHGHVINPSGVPQKDGTVSLSVDGGQTLSYNFPVSSAGEYSGQAPPGEYTIVYRAPDTPEGKIVDYISGVQVIVGQDTVQDIDMTRREFIARLSPQEQQLLQELSQANIEAASGAKRSAAAIDADLQIVNLDLQAAGNARATAAQNLGAAAGPGDLDEMTAEIEDAKLTEIEALMTKDAAADPSEPVVFIGLARAEAALRNYLDAESNFKTALDLALKEDPPRPQVVAMAQAGLGDVYARTLMVDDANAAFDAAAKADPSNGRHLSSQPSCSLLQCEKLQRTGRRRQRWPSKPIPDQAILYYIKADGLSANARVDPETNKLVLPPGSADAYRRYLALDPNGPFAANAATMLERAGEPTAERSSKPSTDPETPSPPAAQK